MTDAIDKLLSALVPLYLSCRNNIIILYVLYAASAVQEYCTWYS